MNYNRYLKNIRKQYGKNLKAAEKRQVIVSTWKQTGWQDYSQLEERLEVANGSI